MIETYTALRVYHAIRITMPKPRALSIHLVEQASRIGLCLANETGVEQIDISGRVSSRSRGFGGHFERLFVSATVSYRRLADFVVSISNRSHTCSYACT
jgi:hypothetical protein